MRIRVWRDDQNPAIDPPNNNTSKSNAAGLVEYGFADRVTGGIQMRPITAQAGYDRAVREGAPKSIHEVWKIAPSGGIPVWQMRPYHA